MPEVTPDPGRRTTGAARALHDKHWTTRMLCIPVPNFAKRQNCRKRNCAKGQRVRGLDAVLPEGRNEADVAEGGEPYGSSCMTTVQTGGLAAGAPDEPDEPDEPAVSRRAKTGARLAGGVATRLAGGVAGTLAAGVATARLATGGVAAAGRALARLHTTRRRWMGPAVFGSCLVAVVVSALVGVDGAATTTGGTSSAGSRGMAQLVQRFGNAPVLAPAAAPPSAAPAALQLAPALRPHEVLGFAPYWTLPSAGGFDVAAISTFAYFSLDVNADGTIVRSGPGWNGYQSQDLANLITRAHQAYDRVVLTVTCFDQQTLDKLTSDPGAPARLAADLVQLINAKNLDGVNLDFEGRGSGDRQGLVALVSAVTGAVRAANPHWQVTMDTYASSAGDNQGFFDIPALAPSVDAFFVMAYDMEDTAVPSATAGLSGGPGFTDQSAVAQYTAVVPASKVVLGMPYYGYDWPTTGPAPGDAATGPPTPVSYATVAASGGPRYWDPASQTPWTAYRSGTQWHQVWFDDPVSLALKARLAAGAHLAGVGIWALGMDDNDPAMLGAVLGQAASERYAQPTSTTAPTSTTVVTAPASPLSAAGPSGPPASGSDTTTSTAAYSYQGTWNGSPRVLLRTDAASLPVGGIGQSVGTLSSFSTDDPSAHCLASGPPLAVTRLYFDPQEYVVRATTPSDCVSGTWTFQVPAVAATVPAAPSSTTTSTTPNILQMLGL